MHQPYQILLHFTGEKVLIRQNKQDLPRKRGEIRLGHRLLVHKVGKKPRDMYIFFLLVVLKNRLEHILRTGNFLRAFIADMAHARLYQLRLQLFIVAVIHVPQHQRRKEVSLFQAFQRIGVHTAGGNQDQSARFSRILLNIDLRDHAAVTGADENRILNAELLEKSVHSRHKLLIGAQLLRIIEQEHAAAAGKTVHIVHPHFQRIHAAIQEHQRSAVHFSAQNIAEPRTVDGDILTGVRRCK